MKKQVPELRVRAVSDAPLRPDGEFVLYWMIAARRARWNFGLDHALALARELDRPLVVLEALRVGYRWASDRMHRFVLEGMRDNREAFEGSGVLYHPYVEPEPGHGSGLLEALAGRACAVVTDEFPCFFLPRMVAAAGTKLADLGVPLHAVDSNGLLPLRAPDRAFARAFDFRRYLQKELRPHLSVAPARDPLSRKQLRPIKKLPKEVTERWPAADPGLLDGRLLLGGLPIDHSVAPATFEGGSKAGSKLVRDFVVERLERYGERNQPESDSTSGLSPYLHFGHVSAHQVFERIVDQEQWKPDDLSQSTSGKREGWWGMSPPAEGFLDQLVTWRELGYVFTSRRDDYARFESLPDWARATLAQHADDPREHVYSLREFEQARTHDELWNAAQNQLRMEGRMHNYLRMLWGKKILHWSESPEDALDIMVELNNKYAVDGRNPNSYSGIFWTLGRFDRAWGPERPIFGKIRYMTSESTRRKLKVGDYIERWHGWEPSLFD